MPRRKKIHIAVSELKTRDSLIAELKGNPLFEGYDLSTLTVSAVVTSPPPKILKKDIKIQTADAYKVKFLIENFLEENHALQLNSYSN